MRRTTFQAIALIVIGACNPSPHPAPVDLNASPETLNLYSNLFRVASKGFMFGHEDDLAYGVRWWSEQGRSDVRETAGSFPAVYGWDLGKIGTEMNLDSVRFDDMLRWIRQVYERGGINTISWHMDNPVSGGSAWDKTAAVAAILPGGEKHQEYLAKLDAVAEFFDQCRSHEVKIPIIFRPFHEHNGDWFWWGKGNSEEKDYIALWRFTVDYFRNKKAINHLLYAFSPDRSRMDLSKGKRSYFWGYPGDEYVDIIGLDNYWDVGSKYNRKSVEESRSDLIKSLQLITSIARDKNKPAALTETGNEGLNIPNWYTRVLLQPIKENPNTIQIAWVLVWRNRFEHHMYAPYPEHPAAPDFIQFRKDESVFFEDDIRGMYSDKMVLVKNPGQPDQAKDVF